MNKSKYINPENCKQCGSQCCRSFSILYQKELQDIDKNMFSEVERFKLLATDGKIEVKETETYYEVIFNYQCKALVNTNGVYNCVIYNNRPLLCEEYPYHNTTKEDCPFKEKQ